MPEITFKNILYATDFSESSVPACDYALTLCKLTGATLNVLHVIGELSDQQRSLLMPESFSTFEKEVETQSVKDLEAFCREHFDDAIDYRSEIIIGNPFKSIIEKSKEIGADMIIMGTHGRTGLEHVIVGSTAERVVRHSDIPVLTVHSQSGAQS